MTITQKNKHLFLDVPNRRLKRRTQVQSILEDLISGDFHAPAIVLERVRKEYFYVIDGGHRMDGFNEYLDLYPDGEIHVGAHVYPSLNDEQRRRIYNRYNIPIRQTRDDMVHTYKDTIPVYGELINNIPVSIYGKERENLKFSHVTGCYLSAKDEREFSGGWSAKPHEFVEQLQQLNKEDALNIIQFWGVMTVSFNLVKGDSLSGIAVLKTTPFAVLFRLWYQNKDRLDHAEIVSRFSELQSKQLNGRQLLTEWSKHTGRGMCRQAFMDIRRKLNRGQPSNKYFRDI